MPALVSASPGQSVPPSVGPSVSPSAVASVVAPAFGDRVVFWTRTENSITAWTWEPLSGTGLIRLFAVAAYPDPTHSTLSVLASPDGLRFAISDLSSNGTTTQARIRIVDTDGAVIWTSPADLPRTIDMAWSADGTMLALGAQPSPWTVLTFSPNGSVDSTTYRLTSGAAYRLLGFSGQANLIGYASGEAEFWQKPVALDLARGTVSAIRAFPALLAHSSTNPAIWQIDEETGDAVAQSQAPDWVVVHDGTASRLGIKLGEGVTWAGGGSVARVGAELAADGTWPFSREPVSQLGHSLTPPVALPDRDHFPSLVGVHDGVALLLTSLYPFVSYPVDPGSQNAIAVDLASGVVALARAMTKSISFDGLWFAGWIAPRPDPTQPTATSKPTETPIGGTTPPTAATSPAPPATPVPPTTPVPAATASASPVDVDHPSVPGAPLVALWSGKPADTEVTLWRWDAGENVLEQWLTLDAWPVRGTSTDARTVVVSPTGDRIAFLESDSSGAHFVQRLRVFDAKGHVVWTAPDTMASIVDLAWSPDGTRLALGAVPSPWTVLIFSTNGQIDIGSYELSGPTAYRLLGFTSDNSHPSDTSPPARPTSPTSRCLSRCGTAGLLPRQSTGSRRAWHRIPRRGAGRPVASTTSIQSRAMP